MNNVIWHLSDADALRVHAAISIAFDLLSQVPDPPDGALLHHADMDSLQRLGISLDHQRRHVGPSGMTHDPR